MCQKHQAEHSALVYPARDSGLVADSGHRAAAGSREPSGGLDAHSCDGSCKAQLWEVIDPVFYAAVNKVKYPRLQDSSVVSVAEISDLVASIYVSWGQ
ncbi:hypothetical protein CYMTET_41091 [Cymbomonas tetramitiformis]|uniref:Uncharacterized protein n=1 Tax=Cymbomonas tetramitiformis TaxID=36881 RepID=A0AAE0C8Y4_9CHLO|nr:hypothetical protein CYMTET_41091 [Cymbomonas tetramitiformis]